MPNKPQKTIILFENDEVKQCGNKTCAECKQAKEEFCVKKCSDEIFEQLKKLENSKLYDFGLSVNQEKIKSKKYTGFFQINKNTFVEILPKLYKDKEPDKEIIEKSRQVFENLIYATNNLTKEVKTAPTSDTNAQSSKLFEIYMTVFCLEMEKFLKRGIKKYYSPQEDNLPYLKGKINFSQHIKYNIARKHMFYVNYDEFTEDIAENRILKSACDFVLKKTKNEDNKKTLRKCLAEFAEVSECLNLEKDLSLVQHNRFFSHYELPLQFAELFLRQKFFMPNKGKQKLPALLFPLHNMFEDYIKKLIEKKKIEGKLRPQYSGNYLIKDNRFNTKMDFVIFQPSEKKPNKKKPDDKEFENIFILDAKYKIINTEELNNIENEEEDYEDEKVWHKNQSRVSQSDLYQLYAYSQLLKRKGNVNKVKTALLYPKNDKFQETVDMEYFDGTAISLIPIDLTDDLSGNDKNNCLIDFVKKEE